MSHTALKRMIVSAFIGNSAEELEQLARRVARRDDRTAFIEDLCGLGLGIGVIAASFGITWLFLCLSHA